VKPTKLPQDISLYASIDERTTQTRSVSTFQQGLLPYAGTGKRMYGKSLFVQSDTQAINIVSFDGRLTVQGQTQLAIYPSTTEPEVPTVITNLQNRAKNSFAFSSDIGLMVVANGEEDVAILTTANTLVRAGIEAPTAAPTVVIDGAGDLTDTKWMIYRYVYAATTAYPLVENFQDINGNFSPRSNPSPVSVTFQITGGNSQNEVTVTGTTRADITKIWIFRTALSDTADLAEVAADAGLLYYIGEVTNDGTGATVDFIDNLPLNQGNSPIELDNYEAPQFRFVIYEDPYFWGFGNMPYVADATWDNSHSGSTGLVTVSGDDEFFGGRDGQFIRFEGITTGGFDNAGTFYFTQLSGTTGTVYTTDSSTPVALPSTGSGVITIQGNSTVLYRSKYRNPFSWGYTRIIGNVGFPAIWSQKVGGGMGTAIAVVPDQPVLKLDTEFPAQCITFNLLAAGTDQFSATKKVISKVYSTSVHFSQFTAQVQGQLYLWSMDYKNYTILQCNGVSITPVSGPLPLLLRRLTQDRSIQAFSHGIYDSLTECNIIWLTTNDSIFTTNICIYQHGPTGYWGILKDYDVLCSTSIENVDGAGRQTWVGTESGFVGRAFVKDVFNNWLPPSGLYTGVATDACTSTTIVRNVADGDFNIVDDGILGNYVLVVSPDGLTQQLAIISAVIASTLTVDLVLRNDGTAAVTFDPVPDGWSFYIGVIECKHRKYFDFNDPAQDKYVREAWVTADGTSDSTLKLLYYPNRSDTPEVQNDLIKDPNSDAYYQKLLQNSQQRKACGFEVVERGYDAFEFISLALKPAT
jgi:hypothetical protein